MKIGTRGSRLALWQADWVAEQIARAHPELPIEIVVLKTHGDIHQETPLQDVAGRGVFVREIESALLRGEIDAAVHSAKDMTSGDTPGLAIAAFCERADPRDALVSRHGGGLMDLPQGATVATSAPRRVAQLLAVRPDLKFTAIRGNVDTRLEKLHDGAADALILAYAGLARLARQGAATEILPPEICLPQVGQGCVAVQCRAEDSDTMTAVAQACDHAQTRREVICERRFLSLLGGGCTAPVAGFSFADENNISLFALVAAPDGKTILRARSVAPVAHGDTVAQAAYDDLMARGAAQLLGG